jgi:hypothetical protein
MQLRDMREAIDKANANEPWPFTGDDFFETLSIMWLTDDALKPPFRDDLVLASSFLRVVHISHVPETLVLASASLPDLERAIAEIYTNGFVSHCFAFVHGTIRPFRLLYEDEDGGELVFDKAEQMDTNPFSDSYPNCRLEWL